MDLTLVPFGYLVGQDQLVDVHQVASGKRCGCECPSCRSPLIARKGTKKIWHFAHDSKALTKNDIGKCRYSFYVSVRMMARQLIGNRLSIHLPGCEVILSEIVPVSKKHVQVYEKVTESREIVLNDVSLDTRIDSHTVDLSGLIDGYRLAFVFTHPGREEFDHFKNIAAKKSGVLTISLTRLQDIFADSKKSNTSYKQILEDFISNDTSSKSWLYHPNLRSVEQKAKIKLAEKQNAEILHYEKRSARIKKQVELDKKLFENIESENLKNKDKKFVFICRLCNSQWYGTCEAQASCRKCGTSLLVSREDASKGNT